MNWQNFNCKNIFTAIMKLAIVFLMSHLIYVKRDIAHHSIWGYRFSIPSCVQTCLFIAKRFSLEYTCLAVLDWTFSVLFLLNALKMFKKDHESTFMIILEKCIINECNFVWIKVWHLRQSMPLNFTAPNAYSNASTRM